MNFSIDQIYRVQKVVNNNIVIVKDSNGREMIAIGKGLGFKKDKNDTVYANEIMKTYIFVDKTAKSTNLSLFEEVPFDVVEVAQQIIDYATVTLKQKYNVNLLVSLSDHINFSINEFRKGNILPKLVNEEVKRFYKDEYQVGKYAIKLINEKFNVSLQKDEATSIAFHLIVASAEKTNVETREMMESVRKIVEITEKHLGTTLNEESLSYSRYIIHLKFFLSRIISKQTSSGESEFTSIFGQLITKYKDVEECVCDIKNYLVNKYQYSCTDEDCIYLMIHIVRLHEIIRKESSNVKN